ncbi:MAG: gluconate 2-dehydrogenase subunit 3 family protein [Saprospiraceae bacterium]|nr:gluconate 2-dehydrogenase subunit 3 family protein [Saprospiraceae bacterium]
MDRRRALQKTGLIAGTMVATPTLLSLLQSCQTTPRLDWQPEFFSVEEARFVSSLVDMILPRTETPGALDMKVDLFLDKIFARTYIAGAQEKVRAEMAAFNADCKQKFGDSFINLKDTERVEVLNAAEANSGKFSGSVWGTSVGKQEPVGFYRSIKSMAIWAYFTSEEIGEKVLSYDPIPQEYDGCKPVEDVGNRWSL